MGATETRQLLSDYHSFLTLVYALGDTHSRSADEFRAMLNQVSEFLRTASARDIRERGTAVKKLLRQAIAGHHKVLPRKVGVRAIARDFRQILKSEPDIWRFGIPHEWLLERFDTSRLPQTQDLPRHARVGIGLHASAVSVEEVTLLGDLFFLLARARESLDLMMRSAAEPGTSQASQKGAYRVLTAHKKAVCTYSRLGVVTAAAFVETFVNSIGWDEAARSDLTEQERAELRGTRRQRYLSLEAKLERFPKIIRADRKSPIVISDEKQRREPFTSFLKETKQVRDASMHYAPGKEPIELPPHDWLQRLESAAKHAVAVGCAFWSACYPDRAQPMYLAGLHYDGLLREASDRLADAGGGSDDRSISASSEDANPKK